MGTKIQVVFKPTPVKVFGSLNACLTLDPNSAPPTLIKPHYTISSYRLKRFRYEIFPLSSPCGG